MMSAFHKFFEKILMASKNHGEFASVFKTSVDSNSLKVASVCQASRSGHSQLTEREKITSIFARFRDLGESDSAVG